VAEMPAPGTPLGIGHRGYISTQLTVWCGRCYEWEYLEAKKKLDAALEAKDRGWKFTRQYGWVCSRNHG
jgi:hypothetical protein